MENELYEEKFKNVHSKLKEHEHRISDVEDKIIETDKSLAISILEMNVSLKALSGLPDVISKVNENMNKMSLTIDKMQDKLQFNTDAIDNLKEDTANKFNKMRDHIERNEGKIEQLDEDGKFNYRKWLKDNFAKVILSGSAVIALIKYLTC